MSDTEPHSLGEALPLEMARVRDVVMPPYIEIGPAGGIALAMMRQDIDRAARAMAEGDLVEMIDVFKSLQEWKL